MSIDACDSSRVATLSRAAAGLVAGSGLVALHHRTLVSLLILTFPWCPNGATSADPQNVCRCLQLSPDEHFLGCYTRFVVWASPARRDEYTQHSEQARQLWNLVVRCERSDPPLRLTGDPEHFFRVVQAAVALAEMRPSLTHELVQTLGTLGPADQARFLVLGVRFPHGCCSADA